MGDRPKAKDRKRAAPAVALPTPSITLDIVLPTPDGNTAQYRPTFSDFAQVQSALNSYMKEWTKMLVTHTKNAKKAARARK